MAGYRSCTWREGDQLKSLNHLSGNALLEDACSNLQMLLVSLSVMFWGLMELAFVLLLLLYPIAMLVPRSRRFLISWVKRIFGMKTKQHESGKDSVTSISTGSPKPTNTTNTAPMPQPSLIITLPSINNAQNHTQPNLPSIFTTNSEFDLFKTNTARTQDSLRKTLRTTNERLTQNHNTLSQTVDTNTNTLHTVQSNLIGTIAALNQQAQRLDAQGKHILDLSKANREAREEIREMKKGQRRFEELVKPKVRKVERFGEEIESNRKGVEAVRGEVGELRRGYDEVRVKLGDALGRLEEMGDGKAEEAVFEKWAEERFGDVGRMCGDLAEKIGVVVEGEVPSLKKSVVDLERSIPEKLKEIIERLEREVGSCKERTQSSDEDEQALKKFVKDQVKEEIKKANEETKADWEKYFDDKLTAALEASRGNALQSSSHGESAPRVAVTDFGERINGSAATHDEKPSLRPSGDEGQGLRPDSGASASSLTDILAQDTEPSPSQSRTRGGDVQVKGHVSNDPRKPGSRTTMTGIVPSRSGSKLHVELPLTVQLDTQPKVGLDAREEDDGESDYSGSLSTDDFGHVLDEGWDDYQEEEETREDADLDSVSESRG